MAGEERQLEKLYTLYVQEVTLYAQVLTQDRGEAESLVSDAFFKLSLQKTFPPEAKFWLLRVIKNQFIDQQRRQKRWGWQTLEKFIFPVKETPESVLFQSETYAELYQSIEKLNSPYQEVIIFFYFLDWSVAEIGEFMQLNSGQVRTILYRARKQLKEVIGDE